MVILNEIKEKYVETNGIKLHTVIMGSGKPLILLHGFPEFWYCWAKVIPLLKEDFKLIIPDMRGYNLSDKPKAVENYKIEILIEDIKGLSETLGLGKFFLAGHDWGGAVAWIFAEKYPELLDKLIILNAPHHQIFSQKIRSDKKQQEASSYIFEFYKPNGADFIIENNFEQLKKFVFNKNFSENDREKYIEAWSQPGAIEGGVNYYRANRSLEDWKGIIEVPTLVLWGMKDIFLTSQLLEGLSEYVKDLRIECNDKSSHWITHDDPEFVANKIREFILD
ncbi:MAG: alpha/beta hydrolase [Promethearchaeota archaeon]|nr:MAG: alpha/beta hydrolase [Candidatus Lokiarchaeota archaeon]